MRTTYLAATAEALLALLPAAAQAAGGASSPITRLPLLIVLVGTAVALLAAFGHRAVESRHAAAIRVATHHETDLVVRYFQAAVATLVASGDGHPFQGNPSRFAGRVLDSSENPDDAAPVTWRIAVDTRRGATRLICRTAPKRSVMMAEWPESGGRFVYADGQGRWHGHWPPVTEGAASLPSAIRLEIGPAGAGRAIVAPLRPRAVVEAVRAAPASRNRSPAPRSITA